MTARTSSSLQLPRSRRLKQSRDFARAKAAGKRITCGCLVANWLPLAPGSPTRVGVITSRRVGTAVNRSRARRLLREAFRVHQNELVEPMHLVLVARPSIVGKPYGQVEKDLLQALGRGGLLKS